MNEEDIRPFHPNAIYYENEAVHDYVLGELRSIAARDSELVRPAVYGYTDEFAVVNPDKRPEQFEDYVMLRTNAKEFGDFL